MKDRIPLILVSLLILVQGCGNFRSEEGSVAEKSLTMAEAEKDAASVQASINATKTVFAQDGYTILWEKSDRIGIWYQTGGSLAGDATSYGFSSYTLKNGAGTPDGLFTGKKLTPPDEYIGAFHPCPQQIEYSVTGDGDILLGMDLPSDQEQPSSTEAVTNYDFKVAESFEDHSDQYFVSYKIAFQQKTALLRFRITANEGMLALGENLHMVTLLSPDNTIAGSFYMNISDADADIVPNTQSGSHRVTVYTDREVNPGGIFIPMFILPTVKADNVLEINLATKTRAFSFKAKAAKDFKSGYSYTMTIDLPALEKAGLLTVTELSSPFLDCTEPGIYDLSHVDDFEPFITETVILGENWQFSFNQTTARLQNWSDKQLIQIEHPSSMALGTDVTLDITTYGQGLGEITTGTVQAMVLKSESGSYWLVDQTGKVGYIIK